MESIKLRTASTDSLQRVLDTTRDCVIVVDEDMRLRRCNAPATAAFDPDDLSIEGRRLSQIIRDADIHEAFRSSITEDISNDVRLELPNADRSFDVHIAPLVLDGQRCAIGYFYETTQIERLERVRQEFLSNISHELRTPLTSILAFVETLLDGGLDDADNNLKFLNVIRRNAERMHSLLDDILELSVIEAGKVSVEMRSIDLRGAVNDVFASLSDKAVDRGVTLTNGVANYVLITADPIRLEQMLVNLVDNAIKFNRTNGTVTVMHAADTATDRIIVRDTGEGILPEHAKRIFERLYRADRARSRQVGGTGLGLAIVKHLARLHGGEVSMTSDLGIGSTFEIRLPMIPPPA